MMKLCPRKALERRLPDLNKPQNSVTTGGAKGSCHITLPRGCDFRSLSEEERRAVLGGKRVWFRGDSTVLNMHDALVRSLGEDDRLDSQRCGGKAGGKWWLDDSGCSLPAHASLRVNLAFGVNTSRNLREADIAVVNMHGLWSLRGAGRNYTRAKAATATMVRNFLPQLCANQSRMLTLWTLTNSIVEHKLHTNSAKERPLLYNKFVRALNAYEVKHRATSH